MPPKHSFQGVKKKSHNKVDILSRGVLKVLCSIWPAMASKQGHLMAPHYRGTPHLRREFRYQYALVRKAERSKVGRSIKLNVQTILPVWASVTCIFLLAIPSHGFYIGGFFVFLIRYEFVCLVFFFN